MIVHVKERYNYIYMIVCLYSLNIYICVFPPVFLNLKLPKKTTRRSLKRLAMTSTLNSCVASPSDGSAPGSDGFGSGGGCDSSGGEIGEIGEARRGSWKPWWFEWLKVNWWLHLMVKYLKVGYIWWLSTWWLVTWWLSTWWLLHDYLMLNLTVTSCLAWVCFCCYFSISRSPICFSSFGKAHNNFTNYLINLEGHDSG